MVREELCAQDLKKNAYFPFLSGVIRGAGELHFTQEGFAVCIKHRDGVFMNLVVSVLKTVYGDENAGLERDKTECGGRLEEFFSVYLPPAVSGDLLERCCIVRDKYEFVEELPKKMLDGNSAKKAFLRGLFLSCGYLKTPEQTEDLAEQTKSGYTLSFSLNSDIIKRDVMALLEKETFVADGTIREKKTGHGIYIKNSEAICNFLAYVGCVAGTLTLHEIISARRVRNDINRVNNFDLANIDKAVAAGAKQVDAIKKLKKNGIYNSLGDGLKKMCDEREKNPDLGLEELGRRFEPPITKSCVNHRLRKLVELAGESEE
jgi:DNA-binding protein WhiA